MSFIEITKPGDYDYPLKGSQGELGSIDAIRARCSKGSPYVDPDFTADDKSIGKITTDKVAGQEGVKYIWLRAHELCENGGFGKPEFAVVNGETGAGSPRCSSLDIHEAGVGDCWYLAGLSAVCSQPEALSIVVPPDNYIGFEPDAYCGAFHFRFYNFYIAKFVDVVVDDLIPCKAGGQGDGSLKPAFVNSIYVTKDGKKGIEFWATLLEKAFAKFRGNYGSLEGGYMANAMEMMTGGCVSSWYFEDSQEPASPYDETATRLKGYLDSKYFLALGTLSKEAERASEAERLGIVCGHAYAIVGGAVVNEKGAGAGQKWGQGRRLLLQIQNPWGHGEWSGPFSDGDDEGWAAMETDLRTRDDDSNTRIDQGRFWMDFHDVIRFFEVLDYCAVGVGEGSKYCTIRAVWPASLQTARIPASADPPNKFHLCPAFIFEVRRELMATLIPEEAAAAGKCVCSFRITMGEDGVYLYPVLQYMWLIYEIQEGDDETGCFKDDMAALEKFYQRDQVEWSDGWFGDGADETQSQPEVYLKPGRYVLVLPPITDQDPVVIPEGYAGKPIPFTLTLFTENVTTLVPVREGFLQEADEFAIVTYFAESNL